MAAEMVHYLAACKADRTAELWGTNLADAKVQYGVV